MKKFVLRTVEERVKGAVMVEAERPVPAEGEVLVSIKACSLNYRDLLMKSGKSASGGDAEVVPLSDGAGEVVEVGTGVKGVSVGDRVVLTFFRDWVEGEFDMGYHKAARGGSCDGVLSELVTAPVHSVLPIPDYLSYAEAACLPCAALTAWHAMVERGNPLTEGQSILCLGTGGVSLFALQIAKAIGAEVYLISSSDEKLERARQLGAGTTVNYRQTPEWHEEIYAATGKNGVSQVIEVGGPGTLGRSMNSVAPGGKISLIGVLTGFDPPDTTLFPLLARNADLHGIYVGSREMFERMNRFFEDHEIHPVVDRIFPFEESLAAYEYLESGKHFGKVVIEMP